MKKNKLLKITKLALGLSLILPVLGTLTSCSQPEKDSYGCYLDVANVEKISKTTNKNILVLATMEGDDYLSEDFINGILKSPEFAQEIIPEYTVLRLDFSLKNYETTVVKEEMTSKEVKQAKKNADKIQRNTILANRLNLQATPAVFLLSPEMYFISELNFVTNNITEFQSFKNVLDQEKPKVEEFNTMLQATKKGTTEEKLAAIDNLFQSTDMIYRAFMKDLIDEYIKLDKNNTTGNLSQYIMAKADIESSNYFLSQDVENAVKTYANAAQDPRLIPEHRQNAYYLASYILAASQSTDYAKIQDYLQKAIDSYPEGKNTPTLENVLKQFLEILPKEEPENTEEAQ